MSRRRKAEKRPVLPDPKFKDQVVSKFMSCLMYDGKRSIAEKIVYGAFDQVEEKVGVGLPKYSMMHLIMCALILRCVRAVLVVPLIRFLLKSALTAVKRWLFAGLLTAHASAANLL